ncbi:MAG: efflux RND transporter periplasmic adaptor subunit [Gammaproteobacteria bacterium]
MRTITVSEPVSGRTRRFSGVVEAANVASISFEVAGIVNKLQVDVGDRITKGQVLAIMDESAYQLNVDAAQAAVRGAQVQLRDAEATFERLRRVNLAAPGATSDLDVEQAEAARDAARQDLSYANSRLSLAQRDLSLTELRSPFEGVIAQRHVDAFEQVNRGEKIFDLFMAGSMEVAVSVPESEISEVYLGLRGEVRLPAVASGAFSAIVSEVSEVAGAGNAFPVRLAIDAGDSQIRPGVTAEVTLLLGGEASQQSYLIPLGALAARSGETGSIVYRYDPATSTVRQVPVKYGDIRGGDVVVEGGLTGGDIIVIAGVSFLRDGQQVRLMN